MDTLTEARAFVTANTWTFAKTMPQMPHWYVVRDKCGESDFTGFAAYIRAHGEARVFSNRTYVYLDLDRYSYWTMGNPLSETTVIYRAEISHRADSA